jgi:hypothetical protein
MSEATGTAFDRIRGCYRTFAEREARGACPLYEQFANRVAESEALVAFLSTLPPPQQQPNLLFASVKFLLGMACDAEEFERWVGGHAESIRAEMLRRRTQTNEPGRCATLLPVLAGLPEPLALLEVGAAAGLCLFPDKYGYDYGRVRLLPLDASRADPPVFPCVANHATPLPSRIPKVRWRGGLDLNPLDVLNPEEVRWLESLVWPGQEGRVERLHAAIRIAREFPTTVSRGDLLSDLEAAFACIPPDATLVVFHSAVLAYLPPESREKFTRYVRELDAVWISNEAPGVFPDIDARAGPDIPRNRFVLSVNGNPVAFTGPHGQSIDWVRPLSQARSEG